MREISCFLLNVGMLCDSVYDLGFVFLLCHYLLQPIPVAARSNL